MQQSRSRGGGRRARSKLGTHVVDIPSTDRDPKGRSRPIRPRRGEALTRMTGVLTDLGFAPEPPGSRQPAIRLHHCPFLALVTGADSGDRRGDGYGSVICSLHLGLMQGALAALQAPVTVDRLDPFVEPDLCIAHIARASPSRQQARGGRQSSS